MQGFTSKGVNFLRFSVYRVFPEPKKMISQKVCAFCVLVGESGRRRKNSNPRMDNLRIYHEVENLLRQDGRFSTDSGGLNKNAIVEAALALDEALLKMLLDGGEVERCFFRTVGGVKVFDKVKFQRFVRSNDFLPGNYTLFKKKIGLADEDHHFLSESREVVLDWPYKDCVLEGGQTKEDAKRDEIFWNETLAPDEINRLKEPKAFANFVRYDSGGKHSVEHLKPTDNLIIKGNNLLALYSLKERFAGTVKLIYIDPPYYFNKKIAEDNFQYNSNFHLSSWLTFMRNRLIIAKELLCAGGTIWISIGEDGMHYLKVMADEVFGKTQFVGTIPRRTRDGKSDVPFNFSQDFDWLLVYTNVGDNVPVMGRSVTRQYYTTPDFPGRPWRLADLTKQTTAKERANSFFTMVNPKNGNEYPASEKRTWMVTKDTFKEWYDKGAIVFPGDYDFLNISVPYSRKFKDEDERKSRLSSVISDFLIKDFLKELLGNSKNKQGNEQIDKLFGRDAFSYAKPEEMIKAIMDVTTRENDIVLDFFAGSGTTAAVAHKMNRRYIACEQMNSQAKLIASRMEKVIAGAQGGVSKAVGWKGGGEFVYCELATANQKFADAIIKAESEAELSSVWNSMREKAFISYRVNIKTEAKNAADYSALSLGDKKRFLIETLDKNLLYVPYSDMESAEYDLGEDDKRLSREFYGDQKGNA